VDSLLLFGESRSLFLAFAGMSQLLLGAFPSLRKLPIGVSPGEVESEEGDHTRKEHRESLSGIS
jgi:hypothetical protein